MKYIILIIALFAFLDTSAHADWEEAQVEITPVDTINNSMHFMGIDCSDSENCFAIANDRWFYRVAYHSSDAGRNWEIVYKPDYGGENLDLILRLVSYPSKDRCVIGCDSGVVILTNDRGKNWKRVNTPIYDPSNYAMLMELTSLEMLDSMNGVAAAARQIIYTKDGGYSWEVLKSPSKTPIGIGRATILSPTTFLCYAAYGDCPYPLTVYITNDIGENWSAYDFTHIHAMKKLFFADSLNGWAVGGDPAGIGDNTTQRIAATRDGGKNWEIQLDEYLFPFQPLEDVSFHNKDNGIAIGKSGGIFRTSDGGENWLQANSDIILEGTPVRHFVAYQHVKEPLIANFYGKIFYYSVIDDVREINTENNFNIYPNPAVSGSQINITVAIDDYSDIEISIYDIFGRIINSNKYPGLSIGSHKFIYEPSVQMPSGSYFIKLSHNKGILTKKFLIVK